MRKLPSKSDFNNQILPRPVRCFLSGLICCTLFRSRKFCGTFFILVLDFYLQDSIVMGIIFEKITKSTIDWKSKKLWVWSAVFAIGILSILIIIRMSMPTSFG